jgi:hypothetical protein
LRQLAANKSTSATATATKQKSLPNMTDGLENIRAPFEAAGFVFAMMDQWTTIH